MDSIKPKKIEESRLYALKLFVQRADELSNRAIFKKASSRINISFSNNWKEKPPKTQFPGEDGFRSAIMDIRVFYMNKEPTNFTYTCNTIFQIAIDDKMKKRVEKMRKRYIEIVNGQASDLLMKIIDKETGKEINVPSKYFIDLYLSGRYFHERYLDKRNELERLESKMPPELSKFGFINAMFEISRCIFALRDIIKEILDPNVL